MQMTVDLSEERYIVISADGHCGADILDYRPYLEAAYHSEFDAWAQAYHDPWGDIDAGRIEDRRIGYASFASTLNWDSQKREEFLDEQGIAAEVLFPNTAPPFYPSSVISACGPRDRVEYEHRMAGVKAHNRWLADFCSESPQRRAGFAQVLLQDVDVAIAEVRWAKGAGLKGVLLPGDHVLTMANMYYPEYDPFWAACAELELPVHRHTGQHCDDYTIAPAAPLINSIEISFYGIRAIAHLICSGVFERFPGLKFVTTEIVGGQSINEHLAMLDSMCDQSELDLRPHLTEAIKAAGLTRKPSEYFASNCFLGGPLDMRAAVQSGTPNLMFGSDLPHSEGTAPFTRKALRALFADVPPNELRPILSGTALKVYDFDEPALRAVADRIGPTLAEVAAPLRAEERPRVPEDTRCRAFA
jgi:predicted TIM-barrel fold metal-dependent hydrolase